MTIPLEVSCQSLHEELSHGSAIFLLDCREPEEFALARLTGAMLIPLAELPARLSELEPYREREIVVYCHHGIRSLLATRWLRLQGFPKVRSLAGGIDAWSQQIDSTIPRY